MDARATLAKTKDALQAARENLKAADKAYEPIVRRILLEHDAVDLAGALDSGRGVTFYADRDDSGGKTTVTLSGMPGPP